MKKKCVYVSILAQKQRQTRERTRDKVVLKKTEIGEKEKVEQNNNNNNSISKK